MTPCVLGAAFGSTGRANASATLLNPDWEITVTDFGYSDLLFYNAPPFPGQYIHEMLSGEWAGAIGYDGLGIADAAMWLEPSFEYPTWVTNSGFSVTTPLTDLSDPDSDSLPEWFSVISNGTVEIRIDFDMEDTVTGTPMGKRDGQFVVSNRYVMLQTYTLKNISGSTLTGIRLYQMMHAHPANDETADVRAVYDPDPHPGPLSAFRYDITQFSENTGDPSGGPTGFSFRDHVGFSSMLAPSDWGLGHYRGHGAAKPPNTDVEPDGDGDGIHVEVEGDTLENEVSYGPDEVGGALRWDLGSLAPSAEVQVDILLWVRSAVLLPTPVPALSGEGYALLAVLLIAIGFFVRRSGDRPVH
jgi:hypothetical protein